MKLLLVMFYREILHLPRKKYFRCKRVMAVGIIGFIFFFYLESILNLNRMHSTGLAYSTLGLQIFQLCSGSAFAILMIIAPLSAAATISREKESNTLGMLFLTDLTSFHIIVGKFIFQVFITTLLYFSTLPLFMFCISLGGISAEQILAVFAVSISFFMFANAAGVMASSLSFNRGSQGLTVLIIMGYVIIGNLADKANLSGSTGIIFPLLYPISPFSALAEAYAGNDIYICYHNVALQLVLTFLNLILSVSALPKTYYHSNSLPLRVRIFRKICRKFKLATGQKIYGNPVAWRDYYKIYGGTTATWLKLVLALVILIVLIVLINTKNEPHILTAVLAPFALFMLLLMGLNMFVSALHSFVREKEQKTLELLLTTGLTDTEIVFGKIKGIWKSAAIFFWLALISGMVLLFTLPSYYYHHEVSIILNRIFFAVPYGLAICSCAFYASLRCGSMRKAGSFTFMVLFIWHIIWGMALHWAPVMVMAFVYMGIVIFVVHTVVIQLRFYAQPRA